MEGKRGRPSKKDLKAMEKSIRWSLDPETTRSIIAVILIIIGFVLLLSVFGGAGTFGNFLIRVLRIIFGYLVLLIPLVFLFFGTALFFPQRFALRAPTVLGTIAFIIILSAIIHLFVLPESSFKVAGEGGGGGFVGFLISYIFLYIFNFWASFIILLGLLIISVLAALNISLKTLADKFKDLSYYLGFGEGSENLRINNNPGEEKRRWFSFGRKRIEKKPIVESSELVTSGKEAWQPPPFDLLESRETQPAAGDIRKRAEIIRRTLENFGIEVKMDEVNVGPTVTQYTLKPETGVKLNQIVARQNDLSLALAAHPIRIEAPIPGKDAVGIEVPNTSPAIVRARPILESKEFENLKSPLKLALGKDVSGEPVVTDLAKMPHLLIAGSTGSGKSVCINSIITALLYDNSPSKLRIILVDPKRVEFTQYNGVPHLLTPVITRHEQTISALRWAVKEMDDRYNLFQGAGKRDITSYNSNKGVEKMPYIIIIIDELADLMAVAAREVEASIVRLAQLARATGIHLVVATQRPSVDVITGLIKANITCRIAFSVASNVDSRTILDMSGAERLLGNGDMLFLHFSAPKPKRVQGVFLSDQEIHRVTGWLKKHGAAHYQEDILTYEPEKGTFFGSGESFDDEKFDDAVEIVLNSKRASASLLQRHLRIGYARAARLLDVLEEQGLVGPSDGTNRSREILIDKETYARIKAAEA
ncbi:DNA translocase FtsK, partial [Patescibacteria group bacterium]|nr:DNA translocase FtsK [Patescibacteria group bacterium]